MSADDVIFSQCFDDGRRAARIGLPRTTNPYLDEGSIELDAWIEGYETVDSSEIIPIERIHLFHLGREAAERGDPASMCPYMNDDNPERMEIWLLGYAPYVDPELTANDNVPPT
ncbi:Rmf/CrpP family protein [Rhizobium sp.]|uniref:Rmf/CrpP family protein n=1 Tax=Rhizobium sp. TaxID=391 RepID=UPI0028A6704E